MRVWYSLEELKASGYDGEVSLRNKVVGKPIQLYHLPMHTVEQVLKDQGVHPDAVTYTESPPDHMRNMQGEVGELPGYGLYLRYTFQPMPMRFAFAEDEKNGVFHWAQGSSALEVLQEYLDPWDQEWLRWLCDEHPSHMIEFSAFKCRVGVHQRRMAIWEVRKY